ncbi:MAG TPA: heavy metal translocating P-type ATPase [Planctomycetota bacterium]|nr:heavy metal translocating P-type ATPase [Planctomycetota bacterium]
MTASFATRLVVAAMNTAAEARGVEEALSTVPGVASVRADHLSRLVLVRHDSATTSAALIARLETAGFEARHALPGEGSPAYASSPWGVLRPAGRTPAQEAALYRFLTLAGLAAVAAATLLPLLVLREDNVRMLGFVVASVAQAILGARIYAGAWRELASRRPGTDVLLALATSLAYLYAVAVAFGEIKPYRQFGPGASLAVFGTAAAVLTAVTLGRLIETLLMQRTGSAIRALIDLAPPTARVLRGGDERAVLACDLAPGDVAVVAPGERFPADGVVNEGHSAADESVLTGEALPVPKCQGDRVLGGTLNGNGRLVFRVEQACSDTALARVVRHLSEAGRSQPPGARIGARLATVFVLGAVLMAAASFVSGYYHSMESGGASAGSSEFLGQAVQESLFRSVAILLAACPWALLAAVPGAYAAALARAAREGVVFRSGAKLEACSRLRNAVFLRSGILTLDRPDLARLVKADGAAGMPEEEILGLASGLAAAAGYPLGRALREAAAARGISGREVAEAFYFPGMGARGRLVGGGELLIGRRAFLAQEGVELGGLSARAAELECAGMTVRFLAADGRALALLAFVDPVRPGAARVMASLAEMGVAGHVLSSESPATVAVLASQTGIPAGNVCAEVRPAELAARLRAIRDRSGAVMAVGRGDKDVDILNAADVGLAIGRGADPAAHPTLVTLIGGDLHGVRRVLCLARDMAGCARANLLLAVLCVVVGLPLAAMLAPRWVSPIQVALVSALAALMVAVNCYRLARRSSKPG